MAIIKEAYAKINLSLDVLGKLENGYHEVCMIMQTIGLHDTVTVERTKEPGIRLTTDHAELPVDEQNLAYRAAQLFMKSAGITGEGVSVHIEKRIPVAAGLAGGSTDAAAVLTGMNELFSAGFSGWIPVY